MEVYMSDAGNQEMKVQLRALDETLAESGRLNKLVELAAIDPGTLFTVTSWWQSCCEHVVAQAL